MRNIDSASVCFQFCLFFLDLHLAAFVWMSSRKQWVCIFEIWIIFWHSCSWPHMQSIFVHDVFVLCGLSLQFSCDRLWASIMDIIAIYQSVEWSFACMFCCCGSPENWSLCNMFVECCVSVMVRLILKVNWMLRIIIKPEIILLSPRLVNLSEEKLHFSTTVIYL